MQTRSSTIFDGGETWTDTMRAMGAGAIREAFEESSGILLARDARHGGFVTSERLEDLQHYRKLLDKREAVLADVLRKEKLRLALDQLVHFAHWITPANMPKRFDTHFFLPHRRSVTPAVMTGASLVDSIWITPTGAISDREKWNVIFPTKANLMKLDRSKTVDEAIALARTTPVLPVTPWIEHGPDGQVLKIRDDAGYAQTTANLKDDM